jgi:endonuclease-3
MKEKLKEKTKKVLSILAKEYPDARCMLDHKTPLELLVATILAAQCTDERVNMVTKDLFKKYRRAEDYAGAGLAELEADIRPTGFFKNKAKSIKKASADIVERFGGKVPENLEDLVSLPGVGRKTANVVLGTSFGKQGIIVDTHVKRVAGRIGLSKNINPTKIEYDLMELVPERRWTDFSYILTFHGRSICVARKPRCEICPIKALCNYYASL